MRGQPKNKNWPIVEVPADGNSGMDGGAYTHAFVYSNKGNFLVKGYHREIKEYLKSRRDSGLKYVVNFYLMHTKSWSPLCRSIWDHSDDRITIWNPKRDFGIYKDIFTKESRKWNFIFRKDKFWDSEKIKQFDLKRFPNRWIPEFDYNTWIN